MSRHIQSVSKWLPLELLEFEKTYSKCKIVKKNASILLTRIGVVLDHFKKKSSPKMHHNLMQNELNIQELEDISCTLEAIHDEFVDTFRKLVARELPDFVKAKNKLWKGALWKLKLKICYHVQELIYEIAYLFIYYGDILLTLTLKISASYNRFFAMDSKFKLGTETEICSNTCPYLFLPMRKMSVTRLLQIIAGNRAEICCHKLIDCLLETYKLYDTQSSEDDNSSDNSSVEIYKALTKHMSPPELPNVINPSETAEDNSNSIFPTVEELMLYEERNILDLLATTVKIVPEMLGKDSVKKSRTSGKTKLTAEAKDKVLQYYQQILWAEVGNFLEHIILWWMASPLAARAPHSSQHLREWITQFGGTAEIPTMVLSALTSLADALGVFVTTTSWDQLFRNALVASRKPFDPETGKLFSNVLQDLVMLCNQCETTSDWIVGAPLNELPLAEQIPVLHRLDHSIHTTRLWAVTETRKIANNWNVDAFFMLTHTDIVDCLAQLKALRFNDHTLEIEKGGLDVHVQVCALMRVKLVSEVNANTDKLKETPNECVHRLARVCRTISLANLQMIFPQNSYWQRSDTRIPERPSAFVDKYLDRILSPILAATEDHVIDNMILQIMCEAWLDHIYMNKIKFSQFGANQLLCDFAYVETWLTNNPLLDKNVCRKMLKNEVLRRCEGVGRLLLRCPGEQIKMIDCTKPAEKNEQMPAEMYVPNQEQWLELRALRKRKVIKVSFCCAKF